MALDLTSINLDSTAASPARKSATTHTTTADSGQTRQQPASEVSITSTASLLARMQQTLASQPAVDSTRVDVISKAIANGQYTVHAGRIAAGLIQSERALGSLFGS
jgi:flagellar biosynthesis anti-sigma factor FlgM